MRACSLTLLLAAGLDRLIEHGVDRRHQPLGVIGRLNPGNALALSGFGGECRGQPSRRKMGAKQRLADIDVAEACDHPLVEQPRLQAGLLSGAGIFASNSFPSGSGPRPFKSGSSSSARRAMIFM